MKLRHIKLSEEIIIKNETITDIVIEDSAFFYSFLVDLNNAFNGNYDKVEIIQNDKRLNLSSNALFIVDPITFDINSRKIRTDLAKGITKNIDEDIEEEFSSINERINEIVRSNITMYGNIKFKDDIEIADFIKLLDFYIDDSKENLLEKIMAWINSYIELYRIDLFVFVNLFDYLSLGEVESLNKYCMQEKIAILNVSRAREDKLNPFFPLFIIDKDTCIIIKKR